jgi:hypothetical protein
VDQSGWKDAGSWQGYARFVRTSLRPPVWIAGPAAGGTVTQVATTDWGSETDAVRAPVPVTVVRSEAYLAGWRAVATPPHGSARQLTVVPDGLIQSVRVPAGTWTLTFSYRPKGLTEAGVASAAGVAGFVVLAVLLRRGRRRRGAGPAVR